MNARQIALALVVTLSSLAAGAAPAAEPGQLRWDCARTGAPSHREIATAFVYDNFQYMREARPRVYRELRRACTRSGADAVLLVLDRAKRPQVAVQVAAR